MRPLIRVFGFLAALSLLSACTSVESINPIGVSNGSSIDTRLIGAWRIVVEDKQAGEGEAYVFVRPDTRGGLEALAVKINKPSPNNDSGWQTFKVLTGKAGDYMYLNLRGLIEDGVVVTEDHQPHDGGYWPMRYRVDADGSIQLFLWDSADAIKDAITSGRLTGTVEGGSVRITAEAAAVEEFFAEAGERAFPSHFATLRPMGGP